MSSTQLLLGHAIKLALLALAIGLLAHRRYRLCWSFAAYVLVNLANNFVWTLRPDLLTEGYWITQQLLSDATRLAVAVEIGWRVFRSFPGARPPAFVAASVIAVLTAASFTGLPRALSFEAALAWHPRIVSGTIWLMCAIACLVAWYHLPLQRFHRGVLLGFAPYLLVFTTLLSLLRRVGCDLREAASAVDGVAYLAIASWWCYVTWRPRERLSVAPEILRRLKFEEA